MIYRVTYHPDVPRSDLPPIPKNLRERIRRAIVRRLSTEPSKYGVRLRKDLTGLWKLRVGDYRLVYEILGDEVRVLTIAHRREVYDLAARRSTGG